MTKTFHNPTERLVKNGARFELRGELSKINPKNILLITGSKTFLKSIYYNDLQDCLNSFNHSDPLTISETPTEEFVQKKWNELKKKNYDTIVVVGGGSALDFAKALAALLVQKKGTLKEFLSNKRKLEGTPLPLIALPTTAGTGSEVTQYASIETRDKQKLSFTDEKLFPKIALVDPELTHSMPPYLTACTGFDAICQAIESYWSRNRTEHSEKHAVRAIPLLLRHIERVILQPNDKDARFQMSYASSEAGFAIAETKTTAVHSVSYPITTYFKVPHGHACGLTLAPFIRFNASALMGERGAKLYELMGVSSAENAARLIEDLMKRIGLEQRLSKLGINSKGTHLIIQNGFRPDRVKNNPRTLTPEELKKILESIA